MKTIELPFRVRKPILACGADLKGAFALAEGNVAYIIDGFGDLSVPDNLAKFEKAVVLSEKKTGIMPRIVACDNHPGYFSGRFAERHKEHLGISELCEVRHHEAHIAAVITEHSIRSEIIGVAFDGTGYGTDGCIWGGEFFTGNLKSLHRAAHFDYIPMPGGDAAIKQPWRMAASYLYRTFGEDYLKLNIDIVKKIGKKRWSIIKKMMEGNINSPLTSSVGRLFDAVACIMLSREDSVKEAELPMKLERISAQDSEEHYSFGIANKKGMLIIETPKLIRGVVGDMVKKIDKSVIAAKFHNTIAEIIAAVSRRLRLKSPLCKVGLSGGVFQNRYLTERSVSVLNGSGFDVYTHSKVSANDNGIPLGQLAIANARRKCV